MAALATLCLLGSLVVAVAAAPPAAAWGSSEPPPIPSISAGGYMSCGVQVDNTAACWGENGVPSNDYGNVHPGGSSTPPAGVQFLEVNAGYSTGCGIRVDQTITCWGSGKYNKHFDIPSGTFSHVAPGLNYICALRTDKTIACWGGEDADPLRKVVRDVPSGTFTQVSVGNRHACALRDDAPLGTVVCWGHDTNTTSTTRQTVVPLGSYKAVTASNFDSCAIRLDGTAVCWGRGSFGQKTVPAGTYTQVSSGFGHVCGLRPDQSITCWGRNAELQASPPAGTYTQVSTGTFHSCAMPTGGAPAKCWGNNSAGRVQPVLSNVPPQQGFVGNAYSFLYVMANPVEPPATTAHLSPAPTYTVVAGSLPPGLTLSPNGALSGTPTEAGSYTYKVAAGNGLSPLDCSMPGGGNLSCTPGSTSSIATATREHTITIGAVAPAPGTLAGRVTATSTGAAIAGATVAVNYRDGAPAGQATTDANGDYSVPSLYPETYNVTASAADRQSVTQQATVAENLTTTANFTLAPLVRPTIRAVHANTWESVSDGPLVEWSEVFEQRLDPPQAHGYRVHTQPDCTGEIAFGFRGNWLPERQNSTSPFVSFGDGSRSRDMEMNGWQNVVPGNQYYLEVGAGTEFGLTTKQRNERICHPFVAQVRPLDRSTVAGTVTSATGPVAGATVTVTRTMRQPGTVVGSAITDALGKYSIPNVPISVFKPYFDKPYDVTATAPGKVSKTSPATTTGNDSTTTVDFALKSVPVAGNDAYSHIGSDTALVVAAPGVLANDSDADGDALTPSVVTGPANGSLTLNADGSFTYQPNEDFVGTDSFTYKVSDGTSDSNVATVTITVSAGCRGLAATHVGTSGNDRIIGTKNADVISGLGGDDMLNGAGGNDVICGGSGNDDLNTGGGDDYADGGTGDDDVKGDAGNDTLLGGDGADKVSGGDNDDTLSGGAGSPDACNGDTGIDLLAIDHGCESITGVP